MNELSALLNQRIRERAARIAIVGLGYVGLPTATAFAEAGFGIVGIEPDDSRRRGVNAGRSHVEDVESRTVREVVRCGRLRAVARLADAGRVDVIDICVPTPLDKSRDPDVSAIQAVIDELPAVLAPGQLIVLTSTTYPGTTTELLQPALEASGMQVGRDVFLAFAPERIDPGNRSFGVRNTPRVVGGATAVCTSLAAQLFATIVDRVVPVSSPSAAEMAKLLENTFRSVNIALANEVAIMCRQLGLDVWEVIEAAATKPYGFMPFYPGPGLGGHCIPVDPAYLSWKLRRLNYVARFINLAEDINRHMPEYVVDRVADVLNDRALSVRGSKILLLGVSYKADVGDLRESPALDIIALLRERGAEIVVCDPYLRHALRVGGEVFVPQELSAELLGQADLVLVATAHHVFDRDLVRRHARVVLDTRGWGRADAALPGFDAPSPGIAPHVDGHPTSNGAHPGAVTAMQSDPMGDRSGLSSNAVAEEPRPSWHTL